MFAIKGEIGDGGRLWGQAHTEEREVGLRSDASFKGEQTSRHHSPSRSLMKLARVCGTTQFPLAGYHAFFGSVFPRFSSLVQMG